MRSIHVYVSFVAAALALATQMGCDASPGGGPDGGDEAPPAAGVVAAGVRWFGRVDTTDATRPRFSWSGTGFVARLSGTSLTAQLQVSGAAQIFKTVVDGAPQAAFTAAAGQGTY